MNDFIKFPDYSKIVDYLREHSSTKELDKKVLEVAAQTFAGLSVPGYKEFGIDLPLFKLVDEKRLQDSDRPHLAKALKEYARNGFK